MKPRHHISRDAIELIKRFEGYRRVSAQLGDGRWTIGYGHTKTARPGAEVSENDAEALLTYDLMELTGAVNELTYTPLTQNQFDALVCFAFNIGLENFRHSTVLRRINEGAMLQAACALEMWRKADFEGERIIVDALVRRRAAEKALFLTPTDGWVPAPTPIVRPRIDFDAGSFQPSHRPTNLVVPMDGVSAVAHEQAAADEGVPAERIPYPTEAAANAITARLREMFPEPAPAADPDAERALDLPTPPSPFEAVAPEVLTVTPEAEALVETPAPVVETVAEPAPGVEAPVAEVAPQAAEPAPVTDAAAFALTPAPENDPPAAAVSEQEAIAATDRGEQPTLFAPDAPAADPTLVKTVNPFSGWVDYTHRDPSAPLPQTEALAVEREAMTFTTRAEPSAILQRLPYAAMMLVGLVVFGGGLFWGFTTKELIGFGVALLGGGLFAVGFYLFLDQIGPDED